VVPRLVEQRAAPAAKDSSGVACRRGWRVNERAMGREMPVRAMRLERMRLALREGKEVERPPFFLIRC
jgi:hypothetical protein